MQQLLLGTAGHIDHGKTALVQALTGVNTDRLPEEQRRQITIDLGFAPLKLGEYHLGIVDVPGHERFVKNMLAGATGIDLAMLVVAADDSVKPQTREHVAILEYLQIRGGVIALTKCDLAEKEWTDLVESEIRELTCGTFLADAPIVRVSAKTGEGIETLRSELSDAAARAVNDRAELERVPFRMAIDRVFTVTGHGTVVTGSVASGTASVGDELELQPQGSLVRVRTLQNHDESVEYVTRGQRAAANLSGVHYSEISRGQTLAQPKLLKPTRLLTVQLQISEQAVRPLKHRSTVRLHLGTTEVLASVALWNQLHLDPGAEAFAQLFLSEVVVAMWGQPLVIRSVSPVETLGGGRVVDPIASRIKSMSEQLLCRLRDWISPHPENRAAAAAYFAGDREWRSADLFSHAGVEHADTAMDKLLTENCLVEISLDHGNSRLLHRDILHEMQQHIAAALSAEHRQKPLQSFVEISRLQKSCRRYDPEVLTGVLSWLQTGGVVSLASGRVALADWQPQLTVDQQQVLEQSVATLRDAGFNSPALEILSEQLRSTTDTVQQMLDFAVDQGLLARIGPGVYLHSDTVEKAKELISDDMAAGQERSVSEIRQLLGTSRRVAVPLCEYFDAKGFTHRKGNVRRLTNSA